MNLILILFICNLVAFGIPDCGAQENNGLVANQTEEKVLSENAVPVNESRSEPAAPVLQTEVFQLQNVLPQIVADRVRELMGSRLGEVIVNEASRQVEVSATPDILEKVKSLIRDIDKHREITVDIRIVQVDLNEEHQTGINWSAIVSDYKSFTVTADNRKFSAGTVSNDDLGVLLEALATVGGTRDYPLVKARVNNGQKADLRLRAFDKDVGVSVRPFEEIPSETEDKRDRYTARFIFSATAGNETAVDLRFDAADSPGVTVHMKNNTVTVIGGIFTQTKSEYTSKFPFLGDLPLLGGVFRDQGKIVHRLENILILIPRVTPASAIPK